MRKTLFFLLFLPFVVFAEEINFLCKGEETKYIEGDPSSKRVTTKVIGIQIYQVGMRLDGEWFDNKKDLTDDYLLEGTYTKTKNKISSAREFSTNSLIKNSKIQIIKIDKVEINTLTNNIYWGHEFNRKDISEEQVKAIYDFRKIFKGICKKKGGA